MLAHAFGAATVYQPQSGPMLPPKVHVPFDYVSVEELIVVAGCAIAGAALARAYLRAREPGPVRLLRAVHTGSVNDYAAYAVAGMLAVIAVLTLT